MKLLKQVQIYQVHRQEDADPSFPGPTYKITNTVALRSVRLPADVAPRIALEILKDVFLGTGKPCPPAEALQCLEALLSRIEADPGNWWNREVNPSGGHGVPDSSGPDGGAGGIYLRTDQPGHISPER